jgi:enoyl-CoA hydratase
MSAESKLGKSLSTKVTVEVDGTAGRIVLGAPECAFVFDRAAAQRIVDAVWQLDNEPSVRVIGLKSADPATFCAGGDLREMGEAAASKSMPLRPGHYGMTSPAEVLFAARKPVVAAIGGLAVGGGFELMLASDIVVCSELASFAALESTRGTGGLLLAQLLGRMVPRRVAFDLLYTARRVCADEALKLHLVNEVVAAAELASATDRWVEVLASMAPVTLAAHRASMNYLLDFPVSAATRMPILPDPYTSADMGRGIAAFFDKTRPQWEGK